MDVLPATAVAGFGTSLFVAGNRAMKARSFGRATALVCIASLVYGLVAYAVTGVNDFTKEFGLSPAVAWWPLARWLLAVVTVSVALVIGVGVVRHEWFHWQWNKRQPRRVTDPFPDITPEKGWKPPVRFPSPN